jgi:hypothetical protein
MLDSFGRDLVSTKNQPARHGHNQESTMDDTTTQATAMEEKPTKPCNGHTNYETWLMALWFDHNEDASEDVVEAGRDPAKLASLLNNRIEDKLPELGPPWVGLLKPALGEVDWMDVAEHLIERNESGG